MKLIILNVFSLFLYLFAPNEYNLGFCITVFVLFLISGFLLITKALKDNKNFFNFHVLFFISFLYVNFIYPVFLFPVDPFYFSVFKSFQFDQNLMSKATALAQLGFSFYCTGSFLFLKNTKLKQNSLKDSLILKDINIYKYIISFLSIVFATLVLVIFYLRQDEILTRNPFAFEELPSSLLIFTQVVAILSIVLSFLKITKVRQNNKLLSIFKFNKVLLISIVFYLLIFIYPGDRGPAIQIVLTFIFCYSVFIKPIKFKSFLVIILAGMFILTFISYARSDTSGSFIESGSQNAQINSLVDIGMDLIVNNRNLYVGYEIVEKNGLNYGKSMFYYAFSPFPLLPTFLSEELYNESPTDLSTSSIITKYSQANYGLGTNLIIDLYMQFASVGVMFFMLIFGYFISFINYKQNMATLLSLVFFMSYSIYIPRSSMFDAIRFICWAIVVYYFLYYFFKKGTRKKAYD